MPGSARRLHVRGARADPASGRTIEPGAAASRPDRGDRARRPARAGRLRRRRASPPRLRRLRRRRSSSARPRSVRERIRLHERSARCSARTTPSASSRTSRPSTCSPAVAPRSWPVAARSSSRSRSSASTSPTTTTLFVENLALLLRLRESERVHVVGRAPRADRRPRRLPAAAAGAAARSGWRWAATRSRQSGPGRLGLPMALAIIGRPARAASRRSSSCTARAAAEAGHDPLPPVSINSHAYVAETSERAAEEFFPALRGDDERDRQGARLVGDHAPGLRRAAYAPWCTRRRQPPGRDREDSSTSTSSSAISASSRRSASGRCRTSRCCARSSSSRPRSRPRDPKGARILDHVTIRASDRAASERFYETVLQTHRDRADALGRARPRVERLRARAGERRQAGDAGPAHRLRGPVARPRRRVLEGGNGRRLSQTTVRPACVRSTATTTTARSSSIRTATAPKPCTTARCASGAIVDHLWIRVTDLEASTRFYEIVAPAAGFHIGRELEDRTLFACFGGSFSIVSGGAADRARAHRVRRNRERGRRPVPPRRDGGRVPRQRRPGRALDLPPGLLRRVRPRSRRQQHRGREPQPLSLLGSGQPLMRTYVRVTRGDDPARRPRRVLRVGRAARRPSPARASHRRRDGSRALGQLRGPRVRHPHGDGRTPGPSPLPAGDRRQTADVGLHGGEQGGLRGLRRHHPARRRAVDRRGVPRRPRAGAHQGHADRDRGAAAERRRRARGTADHGRGGEDEVPREGRERRGQARRAAGRAAGRRARLSASAAGRAAVGCRTR